MPTGNIDLCNKDEITISMKRHQRYELFSEYIEKNNTIRSLHPFWSVSALEKIQNY